MLGRCFYRPRPLKVWPIVADRRVTAEWEGGFSGKGVLSYYPDEMYMQHYDWYADRWRVFSPGVYQVEVVGGGGSGGGGGGFSGGYGKGGTAGSYNIGEVAHRTSFNIRLGSGGPGGYYDDDTSSYVDGGNGWGSGAGGVSASGGAGGESGMFEYDESVTPGETGTPVYDPDSQTTRTEGSGGDGRGGFEPATGEKGHDGIVIITLIG